MSILEKIESRVVLADGRIGAILASRRSPVEALCMEAPEVVAEVHTAFADAGSEIIRTNSFAANSLALAAHGLEKHVNEINWQASQIARQAMKGRDVIVAGSVGPLPIAKHPDAEAIFREQIGALLDGGAQMIFFEGFTDLSELLLALGVKYSLHHCPALCAMNFDATGHLADGVSAATAFSKLKRNEADLVGANYFEGMAPLVGSSESPTAILLEARSGAEFVSLVGQSVDFGVRVIACANALGPEFITKASHALAADRSDPEG